MVDLVKRMSDIYYNTKLHKKIIELGIGHNVHSWAVYYDKLASVIWGITVGSKRMNKITVIDSSDKKVEYYLTSDSYKLYEHINSMLKIRFNDHGREYIHIIELMTVINCMSTKVVNKEINDLLQIYSNIAFNGAATKDVDNPEILQDILDRGTDYYLAVKIKEQKDTINSLNEEIAKYRNKLMGLEMSFAENSIITAKRYSGEIQRLTDVNNLLREENKGLVSVNNTLLKIHSKIIKPNDHYIYRIAVSSINELMTMTFKGMTIESNDETIKFINDNYSCDNEIVIYYTCRGQDPEYSDHIHEHRGSVPDDVGLLFDEQMKIIDYVPIKRRYTIAVLKIGKNSYLFNESPGILFNNLKSVIQ